MNTVPLFQVYMADGLEKPLMDVIYSGYIGQGKKVEEFETFLKEYLQTDYVLTLNSGTSGLHLLYYLLAEKDKEVLVSPLTCMATTTPLIFNGNKLKWVDVDKSCNMCLDDLERKLDRNTGAIVIPMWGGMPVNFHKLKGILDRYSKRYEGEVPSVIIDGAHGIGSTYDKKPIGSMFPTMYSLQAIKHVTSIDGGVITLPRMPHYYSRGKLLRWYGIDREGSRRDFRCESDVFEAGTKWHMNDVNATVGLHNFQDVDKIVGLHRENAEYYDKELGEGVGGVETIPETIGGKSSYWIYTIHVERRDEFIKYMSEKGVMCSRVHERNDKHTCYKDFKLGLPSLDKIVNSMVCIPNGWWVKKCQREYIVDLIKKGW